MVKLLKSLVRLW